jgi:hypothetical protein
MRLVCAVFAYSPISKYYIVTSPTKSAHHLTLVSKANSLSLAASSPMLSNNSALTYRLLNNALSRSTDPSLQLLSLALVESVMRGSNALSWGTAIRSVVSHSVLEAIREDLLRSKVSADHFAHPVISSLLDVLSSSLLSSQQNSLRSTDGDALSSTPQGISLLSSRGSDMNSSPATTLQSGITIPELITWVTDRYSTAEPSPEILCALLRLIAQMSYHGSATNIYSHANRKLYPNVLYPSVMLAAISLSDYDQNVNVQNLALVTLWSLLQSSENASANFKRLEDGQSDLIRRFVYRLQSEEDSRKGQLELKATLAISQLLKSD